MKIYIYEIYLYMHCIVWLDIVMAGRSSVSLQMESVFLSNNISLFTNFA